MKTMSELRVERFKNGIKGIEVAKYLGISSGHYSKMEHGYVPCSPEMMKSIEEYIMSNKLFEKQNMTE